jgi:hypothetical protein
MAKGITKENLKSFIVSAGEVVKKGEVFAGLNVLKLQAGQAAQGLKVEKIGEQVVKGRGKEKGKTRKIPSYSALAPDGLIYRMPLNKSFLDKAAEAKLAVGDEFTLVCEGAYESKDGNKGIGFSLVVTKRA